MLDPPGGGGRHKSNGEINLQTKRNTWFLQKYRTVGGVIWLGDPALVAGGEWSGVAWPPVCGKAGCRLRKELREGERSREGEMRQAVKDEGKWNTRRPHQKHTPKLTSVNPLPTFPPSPRQICWGHLFFIFFLVYFLNRSKQQCAVNSNAPGQKHLFFHIEWK